MTRAVAIVTAAGSLRAIVVVLADGRVDADPMLAGAAGIAIAIAAAFGADIDLLPKAAEQPIAAVVLTGSVRSRKDFSTAAPRGLTAGAERDAGVVATFLMLAAFPVARSLVAIGAVTAIVVVAALLAGAHLAAGATLGVTGAGGNTHPAVADLAGIAIS